MVKKWLDGAMASASITVLAGLAVMAVAQPARAGFEWTPPPLGKAPPVAAAPAPMVEAEPLDGPVPMPGMEMEQAPMIRAEPAPVVSRQQAAPVMRPASPPPPVEAMHVAPPIMSAPPAPAYAQAVGFGNDIPLVLAMRQIVPAEFSYSFDTGVNPGARISWSGGRPWDETLADAVRPQGLEVVVSGNTVWLRQGWSPSGTEVSRVSDMTSPMAPVAPSPMPESLSMAPPAPTYNYQQEQTPMPLSPAPMPVPMAMTSTPPVSEQAPDEASYPRRQRPDMDDRTTALMAYAQKAPPVPPVNTNAAYTNDYSGGPVPLMKALPPPPPPPPATASAGMAPMGSMQSPALDQSASRGPVMDPLEIRFWQGEQGASLKEVLNRWAGTADVAILWNSPYDYALPMPMRMHGTFADAVTNLLMGYGLADPRPLGRLHPNLPGGPSVLVIDNYTASTN